LFISNRFHGIRVGSGTLLIVNDQNQDIQSLIWSYAKQLDRNLASQHEKPASS
jgi:hypothetical protein